MAFIEPIIAAYAGAIATILIGIFAEGDKAQIENVLSNLVSFFLLLATVSMTYQVLAGLSIYMILGIITVWRKITDLYLLFGSKTYGSIALVILFAENGLFWVSFSDIISVFEGCIIMVLIVHTIGFIYIRRNKRGQKKPSGDGKKEGKKDGEKGDARRARKGGRKKGRK